MVHQTQKLSTFGEVAALFPNAIRDKKGLSTALTRTQVLDFGVTEIIKNFLKPLAKDPARWGVAVSCQQVIVSVCEELSTWLEGLVTWSATPYTVPYWYSLGHHPQISKLSLSSANLPIPFGHATPMTVNYCGKGVFDVLGWVFSALGPVTTGLGVSKSGFLDAGEVKLAKDEFLIPLLTLYAKWCHTIADVAITTSKKKFNPCPNTVEIAVRAVSRTQIYFSLGASVAGLPDNEKAAVIEQRKTEMETAKLLEVAPAPANPGADRPAISANALKWSPDQLFRLLTGKETTKSYGGQNLAVWNPAYIKPELERLNAELEKLKTVKNEKEYASALKRRNELTDVLKVPTRLGKIAKWQKDGKTEFNGWRELYYFADFWLNPALLAVPAAGTGGIKYGNCAETYPFLMITKYKNELSAQDISTVSPVGGMAITLSSLKDGVPIDLAQLSGLIGPCMNCRRVIESTAVHSDKVSFFSGKETPFPVLWEALKKKVYLPAT